MDAMTQEQKDLAVKFTEIGTNIGDVVRIHYARTGNLQDVLTFTDGLRKVLNGIDDIAIKFNSKDN